MGARLARGRFLLFVDGDYLLDEQWLLGAWPLMDDGRVAGVCGWDLEETTETSQLERLWASVDLSNVPDIQTVDSIASGLIRRSAYETTGGFHPFLKGGEDRDLGLRFIREGWRLLKTRRTMGIHRLADPGHRLTWIEYFRSVGVWSYGEGQACRARWFERPLRKVFLARYATMRYLIQDLQLVGLLTIALSVPAAVLVGGLFVLLGLVGASALAVFLISSGRRRRRSLRETLFDLHGAVYGPYRQGLFAIGLLRSPPPASSYPGEVEIVHSPRAHQ
jgi:cellulose synthase/poly-beta-1,6-N-acetylglucosamine synthase-like glycosyltransferase